MSLTLELRVLSELAGFLGQTTVVWSVCFLLTRLTGQARRRFQIWLGMALGFAAWWLWTWAYLFLAYRAEAGMHFSSPAGRAVLSPGPGALHATHIFALPALCLRYLPQILATMAVTYAVVLIAVLLTSAVRWRRLERAMRFRAAPSGRLAAIFAAVTAREQAGACALWVLPGLSSPATLGWWRPTIVVPQFCEEQDAEELRQVFQHELQHIARRDVVWHGLANVCRAILWFHPAVHAAASALALEREVACDLAVIAQHSDSRSAYAACLLRFARLSLAEDRPERFALEFTSGAALLEARVRSILEDAPPFSRWRTGGRSAGSVLLLGGLFMVLPGVHLSFAARGPAATQMALRYVAPTEQRSAMPRRSLRLRAAVHGRRGTDAAEPQELLLKGPSPATDANPQLAAEHQAGMSVLTEATGYKDGSGRLSPPDNHGWEGRVPEHSAPAMGSSWVKIATETAAQVRAAAGGDGDEGRELRHH